MELPRTSKLCRWQGLGILILALFSGCANHHLPNAPEYTVDPQAEFAAPQTNAASGTMRIAFAPQMRGKPIGDLSASKIQKKRIGRRGGTLGIAHKDTRALFAVPPKALKETVSITMQVLGSGLQSIIEFGPNGLTFDRPCVLSVSFPRDDIDPDTLGGYLLHEDGTATAVPVKVMAFGNRITVVMEVNHFSQYSPDEGEETGL